MRLEALEKKSGVQRALKCGGGGTDLNEQRCTPPARRESNAGATFASAGARANALELLADLDR